MHILLSFAKSAENEVDTIDSFRHHVHGALVAQRRSIREVTIGGFHGGASK
jgi:hypothetical protein